MPSEAQYAKSESLSTKFRQSGNDCYAHGQIEQALDHYDKACIYAPGGSEQLALALANRAAVHLHCHRYGAAKQDMKVAVSILATTPNLNQYNKKWSQRLDDAELGVKKHPEPEEFIQRLYNGSNVHLPTVSAALNTTWQKNKGRCLSAVEDIVPGSLLINEPPICWYVQTDQADNFCQMCCSPLSADAWMPCAQCSRTNVRFCSVSCRDLAWIRFHQFECTMDQGYHDDAHQGADSGNMELLAQRLLTGLSQSQANFVAELLHFFGPPDSNNNGSLDSLNSKFGMNPRSEKYGMNLRSVLSLMSRRVPDECVITTEAFELMSSMAHDTFLNQPFWPTNLSRDQKIETGVRALNAVYARVALNSHGIEHLDQKTGLPSNIGTALYISTALTNHSCLPNAVRTYRNGRIQCRALSHIKRGQEMTISYGPRFGRQRRAERQAQMNTHYAFVCDCAACTLPHLLELESSMDSYICVECGQCKAMQSANSDQIVCTECDTVQAYTQSSVQTLVSETLRDMDHSIKHQTMDVTDVPARIKTVSSIMSRTSDQYLLLYGAAGYICYAEDKLVAEQLINVALKNIKPLSSVIHTDRVLWLYKVAMKIYRACEPTSDRLSELYRSWLMHCLCFYGIQNTKRQLAKMDCPDLVDDLTEAFDELLADQNVDLTRLRTNSLEKKMLLHVHLGNLGHHGAHSPTKPLNVPGGKGSSSPLAHSPASMASPPIGSPLSLMIPDRGRSRSPSNRSLASCTPPELLSPMLASPMAAAH